MRYSHLKLEIALRIEERHIELEVGDAAMGGCNAGIDLMAAIA
jgi:hypothetical protein